MDTAMSAIIFSIVVTCAVILVYDFTRQDQMRGGFLWLAGTIVLSALASLTYLLESDWTLTGRFHRGLVLLTLLIAVLGSYGGLLIHVLYTGQQLRLVRRRWFGALAGWALVLIAIRFTSDRFTAGQDEWLLDLVRNPDLSAYATLAGLILASAILLGLILYRFSTASLPEIANRTLFWAGDAGLLLAGILLFSSGTDALGAAGMILVVMALVGASFVSSSYQVIDLRSGVVHSARVLVLGAIAAVLIFNALIVTIRAGLKTDSDGLMVIGGLSIAIAALLIPLKQVIDFVAASINRRTRRDSERIIREYGSTVSQAMALDALLKTVTTSLPHVMWVDGSCLILLNSTFKIEDGLEMLVMYPDHDLNKFTGLLSLHSPLYNVWAVERRAITQFDLEYDPAFRSIPVEEREFFQKIQMRAYAPIILENALIGALACGATLDDTPFYPHDLDLLAVLAQQTGAALANARMVDDLRHLNKSMSSISKNLKDANAQLNQMDAIKTDFVTIASHELRTPLAQVRGYTDIIGSLNERNVLDQQRSAELIGKLSKAVDRMEELIAAMLDVSQLDVNAMSLQTTETNIESIINMAIEPLNEAINERKIRLSARGLRGLPKVQADLQRLVQAFRNIIVNAVKYTPDGGKIDIRGRLEQDSTGEGKDSVLIEIADTGVGIDKKNLEMIFKKFFRGYDPMLHSTGSTKFLGAGPGLGLTIARGVIEGHGGEVWGESEGHDMENYPGSTFWIRLPVSTPEGTSGIVTFEGDAALAGMRRTDEIEMLTRTTSRSAQAD